MSPTDAQETEHAGIVPGPKGLPLIGNLDVVAGNSDVRNVLKLRATYGDIIRLKIGSDDVYLLTHPDMAEQVLQMNNRNYIKGDLLEKLREVAGNGLFTSEGEFWRKQRRMMQPAFHRTLIAGFGDMMVDETDALIERWAGHAASGESFRIDGDITGLTLTIVAKALFTTSMTPDDLTTVTETIGPLLEEVNRRQRRPFDLREKLPTAENRAFDHNLERANALIHRIIDNRRQHPGDYKDLLQMLMDMRDEDTAEGMSDQQLRDEVITLFVAGHETTATALSWAFMLLSEQSTARVELQKEVDTVLAGRRPTADDYPNLPYTLAVFEETMRLYPPVTMIPRTLLDTDTLGGYAVPKGASVVINTYALHHHPDFWENPEGFDPTRFFPENTKGRHQFAYVPFSRGPRFCIGEPFAKLEATMVLARMTQKFDLNLTPGQNIEMRPISTLRPEPGVFVTLKPRQ